MARWLKKCTSFVEVRKAVDDCDLEKIQKLLVAICDAYAKENWDFADDFASFKEEIEEADVEDEEIDYCLSNFYDLCDNARVWLDI